MKYFSLLICLLLVSCGVKFQQPPSVCDNIQESSVLCDIANKNNIRLETVGDLLLAVNLRIASEDPEKAISLLNDLESFLELAITPEMIKDYVVKLAKKYPEIVILSPYLPLMSIEQPITKKDKEMIIWWINYNRTFLQ